MLRPQLVIESDSVYGFQNGSDRSPSPPLWIMDESNSGSTLSVSWREIVKAHFLFALLSPTKRHMRHIYSQNWKSKNRTALMFLSITVVWILIKSRMTKKLALLILCLCSKCCPNPLRSFSKSMLLPHVIQFQVLQSGCSWALFWRVIHTSVLWSS